MNNNLHDIDLTDYQIADILLQAFNKDFSKKAFYQTFLEISSPVKNSLSTWNILFDKMKKDKTLFFSFNNIPSELFPNLSKKEIVSLVENYLSFANSTLDFLSSFKTSQTVTIPKDSAATILSNTTTSISPVKKTNSLNAIKKYDQTLKGYIKTYSNFNANQDNWVFSIPLKLHHPVFQEVYENNKNYLSQFSRENEFLEKFLILYEKQVMQKQINRTSSSQKLKKF